MKLHNGSPVSGKIQVRHRSLRALVYVRQSSVQQIHDHPESRARQYALADRAVALGWTADQVVVIDEDQGLSGQRAEARHGFQRLLTDVTLGQVGIIFGLEMSRLARSCKDWHQLLEVCALVGTLLADQDGIYDPRDGNDRLLLGLTGIMSEAELVTMRNRLIRGRWHKAERGELFCDAPIGYVKTPAGTLERDPDEQVQGVVRLIFERFQALGTAMAVVREFRQQGIRLGVRDRSGARRGQLRWVPPYYGVIWRVLRHPLYAGAYVYGRASSTVSPASGRRQFRRPRLAVDEWSVLIRDRLPAYITWDQYRANCDRLQSNDLRGDRRGPVREGPGLLTGLMRCGVCGWRLSTTQRQTNSPYYRCVRHLTTGESSCSPGLAARCVDRLASDLVLQAVAPAALAASLQACEEADHQRNQFLKLRQQAVERARYEAERAERQFHRVEPENRLVARSLEQNWETALRAVREAEAEYEQAERSQPRRFTDVDRQRLQALAQDVPALWQAATTTAADRKAVIRILIEAVTVFVRSDSERVRVTIRWRGGSTTNHEVLRPLNEYRRLEGYAQLRETLTQWRREGLTAAQIADRLNAEGIATPKLFGTYNSDRVRTLLSRWKISTDRELIGALAPDEWWLPDLIQALAIDGRKIRGWIKHGWLTARRTPAHRRWIVWADVAELERLRQLRDQSRVGVKHGGLRHSRTQATG